MSTMRNKGARDVVEFELPVPVLIQLDKDESLADKMPAKIRLSGSEDAINFDITVIRLLNYDVEELVDRRFYLLLPFLSQRVGSSVSIN